MRRYFAIDLLALTLTLLIGAAGGGAAWLLGLPLALLLGSLTAVGVAAALGVRVAGVTVGMPQNLRMFFVPVIGVAIGGAFTPAVLRQIPDWWASLLALCVYIPLAHGIGYWIYRRGGLPVAEAFFGAVPGGLIESVTLGEEAGADSRMLILLQFLRLILTIVAVPMIFWVLTGHQVGSAAGAAMAGADRPLGPRDMLVLLAAGAAGFAVARAVRLPAAVMTGPLLASAFVHLMGWTQGTPPDWAIAITQVVIGSALGVRFLGMEWRSMAIGLRLAVLNVSAALVLAFGFGWALAGMLDQPPAAVFLAFAPGGLAEMSLIALSLQISVVYVTLHHVLRIVLSVTVAKAGARWLRLS